MIKKTALVSVSILSFIFIASYLLGYHGPRNFKSANKLPDAKTVVENARLLKGTPYDPLMGEYNNIGAKWGFIVCSDVVNIAYGLSGYSWKQVLKTDFARHADAYDSRDGNIPANPYFHRRARNLFSYFKANQRLESLSYTPRPGDVVFYRKSPAGSITHVTVVTEVDGKHYRLMESAPRTLFAQEVSQQSPLDRGWLFAGFGRVY